MGTFIFPFHSVLFAFSSFSRSHITLVVASANVNSRPHQYEYHRYTHMARDVCSIL